MAASVRWPTEDDGPWLVTAHWERIEGRAVIVGLDIRSFVEGVDLGSGEPGPRRLPIGDGLAEVTQRVLRGISISTVRDATRSMLITEATMTSLATRSTPLGREDLASPPEVVAATDRWVEERISALTAKGEPRKRRPAASEDLLRHVAALYEQAVSQGDTKPAKYVEDRLRATDEPRLSTAGGRVLVRQWIRRARERGYLTVPPVRRGDLG